MTSETDEQFVERISRAIYDSNSTHKDADLIRLFALARRGAAADAEIERLRAALRRWQQSGCPDCGGDCSSANPPVACCIVQETRAALEERT